MPRGTGSNYYSDPEEVENLDTATWATNVGGSTLSGATAGLSVGGPWGALIGGVLGAGVGVATTAEQERAYREAQEQQNTLNQDLQSRDVYDFMLQQQGMAASSQREDARLAARQAAARGGLTPAAAAQLEQNAVQGVNVAHSAALPGVYLAAQQADLQRRGQVLDEYTVAQQLATQNAPPDYSQLWGQVAAGAAQYGTMTGGGQTQAPMTTTDVAAANNANVAAVSQAPTGAPQQVTLPPQSAVNAVSMFPVAPGGVTLPLQGALGPPPAGVSGLPAETPTLPEAPGAPNAAPAGVSQPPGSAPPGGASPSVTPGAANPSGTTQVQPGSSAGRIPTEVRPETVKAAEAGDVEALLRWEEAGSDTTMASLHGPPAPAGVDPVSWDAWAGELLEYGVKPEMLTKEFYEAYNRGGYAKSGRV